MSKQRRRVRQTADIDALLRSLREPFVAGAAEPPRYPRAGVGPAPDGMPASTWAEAGEHGLYYIGRDGSGEWRFTPDPHSSAMLRDWGFLGD